MIYGWGGIVIAVVSVLLLIRHLEKKTMASSPECPYCDKPLTDLWEYNLMDNDPEIINCPECDGSIKITASISIDYDVEKAEKEA